MLAEREKLRGELRASVADYIKALHETGSSSTTAADLFKVTQSYAIPIYFHDRHWWNSYRSSELGVEARAIVDSMIFAGPGGDVRRNQG